MEQDQLGRGVKAINNRKKILTENDFPVLAGPGDLVDHPHLAVGHPAQHEHDHAGLVLGLTRTLVLVPVVPHTVRAVMLPLGR